MTGDDMGRVIIEPISAPVYDLDALIGAMNSDSFPDDVDFGLPVGAEAW